jgi:hypothetical protein
VARVAESLGFSLTYNLPRDRDAGVDGQIGWQSDDGISIHYTVDAMFGADYVTVAGPSESAVRPYAVHVLDELEPWTVGQLIDALVRAGDVKERCQLIVQIGLAAPVEFDEGCFRRIRDAMANNDARIRYVSLWATTYTGYREFIPTVRDLAKRDPEEWVRARAAIIAEAFNTVPAALEPKTSPPTPPAGPHPSRRPARPG